MLKFTSDFNKTPKEVVPTIHIYDGLVEISVEGQDGEGTTIAELLCTGKLRLLKDRPTNFGLDLDEEGCICIEKV